MTYKEAFDRITSAYIADKLEPWKACACFIGNLLGGNEWESPRLMGSFGLTCYADRTHADTFISLAGGGIYTPIQIFELEKIFLTTIHEKLRTGLAYTVVETSGEGYRIFVPEIDGYEDALFEAMEITLEALKQIHIAAGEEVDDIPFVKRQLQAV